MNGYLLDPLRDPRWGRFVERHPHSSLFHSVPWLKALQKTYGYQPLAITCSGPSDELQNGIAFCWVSSWLTGRRMVSVPFSDHCEPLCDSAEELELLLHHAQKELAQGGGRFLEIRPVSALSSELVGSIGLAPADRHFLHVLDLNRSQDEIFRSFDKDSIQRRVQRADRAKLTERHGKSIDLLNDFYALFLLTRARHRLPATPYPWFRNLLEDPQNNLEFRIAYSCATPVSAILTFQFKGTVVYKNGCSDEKFNHLGAAPWLLWRAIDAAKLQGSSKFDFGRTEENNQGLLAFKNHWVSQPSPLIYWRFPAGSAIRSQSRIFSLAQKAFAGMPAGVLRVAGRLLYRHIG